jgi:hypothetical protein
MEKVGVLRTPLSFNIFWRCGRLPWAFLMPAAKICLLDWICRIGNEGSS